MKLNEIQTKDDVLQYISDNISNDYIKTCFETASCLAGSYLIQYDDLAEIKIAQRFLRHTELLLAKTLKYYLIHLLKENGYDCFDNKYNTLYIRSEKMYVHIFDFDKFVSIQNFPDGKSKNIYLILAQETEEVIDKINKQNVLLEYSEIVPLRRFVINYLNEEIWRDGFNKLFLELPRIFNEKKIFGITKIYSSNSENSFRKDCINILSKFDYENEFKQNLFINKQTYDSLINQFHEKKQLLISNFDFANSYITSEWLYQYLLKENNLDKTFIVSGYLKSIEQLLFYYAQTTKRSIPIKKGNFRTMLSPDSDNYIKTTLGNLSYLLKQSGDCFMSWIDKTTVHQLTSILDDWIDQERNGYFHKDNINNNEIVVNIRKRTYLLYFLLLGSLKDIC